MILYTERKKQKQRKERFLCFALLFLHIPIKLVTLPFHSTFTKESRATLSPLFTTQKNKIIFIIDSNFNKEQY